MTNVLAASEPHCQGSHSPMRLVIHCPSTGALYYLVPLTYIIPRCLTLHPFPHLRVFQ